VTRRRKDDGQSGSKKPERIAGAVREYLESSGLKQRVEQASVIEDWPKVVGPQIAKVTEPISIAPDGTLMVAVKTNSWMQELSLMEPELIRVLNIHGSARRVRKIRFRLKR
jgi:predicted nucleic acid-binding Zn ribbon protein